MFDERRHRITAGIDKSYLLEPITVDAKPTLTTKRSIAAPKPTRYDQKLSNYSKVIVPPLQNRVVNQDINGNNHFSSNESTKINTKPFTNKVGITRKLTPAVTSPPLVIRNENIDKKVNCEVFSCNL